MRNNLYKTHSGAPFCNEIYISESTASTLELVGMSVSEYKVSEQKNCSSDTKQWFANGCPKDWIARCNQRYESSVTQIPLDQNPTEYFYIDDLYIKQPGYMESHVCVTK